jgi:hypothetical protein
MFIDRNSNVRDNIQGNFPYDIDKGTGDTIARVDMKIDTWILMKN